MILDDLVDLATSALSTATWAGGTNVFAGQLPSTPSTCLAFLGPYGGLPAAWAMSAGVGSGGRPQVERPRVQVLSRAEHYADAEKNAVKVRYALAGRYNALKNGVTYHQIAEVAEPFFLERDAAGRDVFALNLDIVRSPATSS